jgi:hypothetical protein
VTARWAERPNEALPLPSASRMRAPRATCDRWLPLSLGIGAHTGGVVRRRAWLCTLTVLSALAAPARDASAQRLSAPRFAPRPLATLGPAPAPQPHAPGAAPRALAPGPARAADARPSPLPFVLAGAAVGLGAVAVYANWYAHRQQEECFCGPSAWTPLFVGGALAGGVAGAVVYAVWQRRGRGAGARAP